jgi:hypothetical protein
MLVGTAGTIAYLALGRANPSSLNLASDTILLEGGNGQSSISVAIGDVNGDGLGEMLLGAPVANQTYVIFGNRTPWLSSDANSTTYNEGASYVILNPNMQLHENEAQIIGAAIQITENYQPSEDRLKATQLPPGISAFFNTTSGTLTLAGIASAAEYQTTLEQIAYSNSAANPSTASRTVTFQANDGRLCGMSNSFKQTLNINANKPTVSPSGSPSSGSNSGSSNHGGIGGGILALIIALPIGVLALLLMLGAYRKYQHRHHRHSFWSRCDEFQLDLDYEREDVPLNRY